MKKNKNEGFTLIEVLVVIGILAVLVSVVLIAINPARQFAQARDSQRTSNINAILNAIGQRLTDNKGTFAGSFTIDTTTYNCGPLPTTATAITTSIASDIITNTGALGCLVPTYMPSFPIDPTSPASPGTGYTVMVNSIGRTTVATTLEEPSIPRTEPITAIR